MKTILLILLLASINFMKTFKTFLLEQDSSKSTSQKQKTAKEIATDFITLPDVEGFREKAYQDTGGIWTIGPGITKYSTGTPVKGGDVVSLEQGMQELQHHIDNKVIPNLSKKIPTWNKMSENQKAALISFSYNAGENFYGSKGFETITQSLSDPANWNKVPDALNLYNKGKNAKTGQKEVLPGLVKRRSNEGRIWSGTYEGPQKSASVKSPTSTPKKLSSDSTSTTPEIKKIEVNDYEIKSGDSLSKIAQQNKTTVEELAKLNNITDVNKIKAGEKIKLPKS